MRASLLIRPALALFVVSVSGCKLVDLDSLQAFGCGEGGRCPSGLICCSDSMCKASCTSAGGGGGETGGGAGGGNGGGGVTGGGSGGGSADAGRTCGPDTCPSGCCDGDTCISGQAAAKCGRAGAACAVCPSGESCNDGACSGCLQTCSSGCCSGATCETRSAKTCGANGMACTSCGIGADTCTETGACQCGTGPSCNSGQRCVAGQCVCDAESCPGGCCTSSGACLRTNQQSGSQCGLGGVACAGCDAPPSATCSSTSERTAYRAPGTCAAGTCQYPAQSFVCAFGCTDGSCVNDVCQGCLVAPQAVCVGNVRRSYETPGTCGTSGCTYAQVDTTCSFGCNGGACNPDPCAGVSCSTPPAARCNGNVRVSYAELGSCSLGSCTYAETQTTCSFGCDGTTGQCVGDPCAGVTCTAPPVAVCMGNTRRSYVSPGSCSQGSCTYAQQDVVCANGCNAGQCLGDPCAGVTCSTPPAPICLNGTTRRTYSSSGTCALGSCNYTTNDTNCPFGCNGGACNPDPCSGVTCNTPPGPTCQGNLRRTYSSTGTCSGGSCSYTSTDSSCNTPPPASCTGPNNSTRRTYSATGTCSNGSCTYAPTDTVCSFGCTNGVCNPDTCAGVTCTTPPAATCVNATTRRTFGSPGTCGNGTCNYPQQDQVCNSPPAATCIGSTLRTFSAAGACSNGQCTYTQTDTNCANGCSGGACLGDPCAGVTCNSPPGPTCSGTSRVQYAATGTCSGGTCSYASTTTACNTPPAAFCASGTTLRTYTSAGTCSNGACSYATSDTTCNFGCSGNACNPDPCAGVTCNTPPGPVCANATTRTTFSLPGTCGGGACSYVSSNQACNTPPGATCNGTNVRTFSASGTCSSGSCTYSPIDTPCNTPPGPTCTGNVLRTYGSGGTCSNASCSYPFTDTTCQFGCAGTACAGDPCATMTCNSPPPATCADAWTLSVPSGTGTCSNGQCSYTSTTQSCANGCANGACQPCNAATCANGCCTSLGTCRDNDAWCQGVGGVACGLGCRGRCDSCDNYWQCVSGSCECGGLAAVQSLLPICPDPRVR